MSGGEIRCNEILAERCQAAKLEIHWVAEDPERRPSSGSDWVRRRTLADPERSHRYCAPAEPGGWATAALVAGSATVASTDWRHLHRGLDTAKWLDGQALEDDGVKPRATSRCTPVVGERQMQHEPGASAVSSMSPACSPTSRGRGSRDPLTMEIEYKDYVRPDCADRLRAVKRGKAHWDGLGV